MNRRGWLSALGSGAIAFSESTAPVVSPGWDWWLPSSVAPLPYSGFITWGTQRFSEMITVSGIQIPWSKANPAPGEFDWKFVEDAIRVAQVSGMRVGLHVKGVERRNVPDWVIRKHGAPVLDVAPLQDNQPWRLQIVPPWHAGVLEAYTAFLRGFAKTGIPQRREVVYGYIHGISPSRGEELFLRAIDIDEWEKTAGLTPDALARCLRARLDAMLDAFRGVEHKLAWMSGGPIGAGQPGHETYAEKTRGLFEDAVAHGTGWRGGGIDFLNVLFESRPLGSTITNEEYVVIDESLPLRDGKRFMGDENEEYGKGWEWRFGPAEQHAYRHRVASLHGLQLGENFQMVGPETLKLNPGLNRYVLLTQGRNAANSPDGWAYLRECEIRSPKGPRTVKNLERFLIQRDVEGSESVACERLDRHPIPADPPDRHYDYDGRRTNRAARQDGLAFELSSGFWRRAQPAVVKVTFTDRARTSWRIEATGVRSAAVENTGDGERKTATFRIDNLPTRFRLVAVGPGDLTVTFVRVVKA